MEHGAAAQIQAMIDRETGQLRERMAKKDSLLRLFVAYFEGDKIITPATIEAARQELDGGGA